jgi:hypothetical protein
LEAAVAGERRRRRTSARWQNSAAYSGDQRPDDFGRHTPRLVAFSEWATERPATVAAEAAATSASSAAFGAAAAAEARDAMEASARALGCDFGDEAKAAAELERGSPSGPSMASSGVGSGAGRGGGADRRPTKPQRMVRGDGGLAGYDAELELGRGDGRRTMGVGDLKAA